MVHEKCRSELYSYRTGEGELEQVTRFAVPEEKVSSSDNYSKIRDFAHTTLCYNFVTGVNNYTATDDCSTSSG